MTNTPKQLLLALALAGPVSAHAQVACTGSGPTLPNPVMFATQVPVPNDFATVGSVFANHMGQPDDVFRGGDLMIRYENGCLRNLTAEAGFGQQGFQGSSAIAVRDPVVHWSGERALFSMLIGGPDQRYEVGDYYWQLYEVSGIAQGQSVAITAVPNQPQNYNNISPAYGSDDRILFTSDRPRGGERHLYPQQDEYESTPTVTGLWSLEPISGALKLMQHSPSGSFDPIVDSYGRVLFTRWDHLQRDQQADAAGNPYGNFDFSSEAADASTTTNLLEVFPEPRPSRTDLLAGTNLRGHRFNHFFPWQINQDGTEEETLNHIGRHELHTYFEASLTDDPNLDDFTPGARPNVNDIFNVLQLRESSVTPGRYYAIDAPEFQTHASGQVVAINAPPQNNPDNIVIEYVTHPDTETVVDDGATPPTAHSGHYRNPLPLSDGRLVASHTAETRGAGDEGSGGAIVPRYDFRLRLVDQTAGDYLAAGATLTSGIEKSVTWFDPDQSRSYSGALWELYPVEVRAMPAPPNTVASHTSTIDQIFAAAGLDRAAFSRYLDSQKLALMIVHDTTTRDQADRQQPFNLRVPDGQTTVGAGGKTYDVDELELFQADQVRGIGGIDSPQPGRRVLARAMHAEDATALNPNGSNANSVPIASDGSVAAFVPAQRALSWQINGSGTPVVRERYWLTFQSGEIRACDGCHGINTESQAGTNRADQSPQALADLLDHWKVNFDLIFSGSME